MKTIILKGGIETTVDDVDYNYLNQFKWYLANGYPASKETIEGKRRTIIMSRVIMGAKKGEQIDHIDRNKLNNQRANLRFCTQSQNMMNKTSWGSSKYLDTATNSVYKKWRDSRLI